MTETTTRPDSKSEIRETAALISSEKVQGTNVYRSKGDKMGKIEHLMIDKVGGKVAYAVMSFGGFMGMGHDHYPLPWSMLDYNERLGGYEVNIDEEQLKRAPKYTQHESWDWGDLKRGQRIHDYWRAPPYWGI